MEANVPCDSQGQHNSKRVSLQSEIKGNGKPMPCLPYKLINLDEMTTLLKANERLELIYGCVHYCPCPVLVFINLSNK